MPKNSLVTALVLCSGFGAGLALPSPVSADVVIDWAAQGVAIGSDKQIPNAPFTRALAMMHVAMFEAMNATERRYRPYKLDLGPDRGTSKEAAGAAAAHMVLVTLFPDEKPKLDQALQASLATISDGEAKTKGVELGKHAGTAIVASRADDGSGARESYRPFSTPGVYVPTALPIEITSGGIKPWAMEKGSQFRPPPPELTSDVWTRDLNEIREVGALQSKTRTAEQTEIGRFWFFTGPRTRWCSRSSRPRRWMCWTARGFTPSYQWRPAMHSLPFSMPSTRITSGALSRRSVMPI
jgi:hypothetical protein